MEKDNNIESKKKLSPTSTVLLTITATLLAIVLYRVVYWAITGA